MPYKLISIGNIGLAIDGGFAFHDGTADYFLGGWFAGNSLTNQFLKSTDGKTGIVLPNKVTPPLHSVAAAIVGNREAYLLGGDIYTDFRGAFLLSGGVITKITTDSGIGKRVLMGFDYNPLTKTFVVVGGQEGRGRTTKIYNDVLHSTDYCKKFRKVSDTPFETGNLYQCVKYFKGKFYKITGGVYDDETQQGFSYPREVWCSDNDGITWKYLYRIPVKGRQYPQLTTSWDGQLLFLSFGANIELSLPKENMSDIIFTSDPQDKSKWQKVENLLGVNLHAHAAYARPDGIGIWAGTKNPVPNVTNNLYKIIV